MKITISKRRSGLTLVELLVVIAIMGLLTALIVPQVRLINKDRNIREAARVVGTGLTQARDRATSSGGGGLLIERNINLRYPLGANDSQTIFYAGTRLYQLRDVPNLEDDYLGGMRVSDPPSSLNANEFKMVTFRNRLIPNQFRLGDYISVPSCPGGCNRNYLITHIGQPHVSPKNWWPTWSNVQEIDVIVKLEGKDLANTFPGVQPNQAPAERAYEIKRQPRKMKNSQIDLPDGYIVDLRYSGSLDEVDVQGVPAPFAGKDGLPDSTTQFSLVGDTGGISITFNEVGELDRIAYLTNYDDQWSGPQDANPPLFPIPQFQQQLEGVNLFVTEYRPEDTAAGDYNATANRVLSNPASLWVTLNARTGGVNVGYNAADITGNAYQDIRRSQLIARKRISANQ